VRLSFLMPLTRENIARARKLSYDALEVSAGWATSPTLEELEADLPALKDALGEAGIGVTSVAIYGNTIGTPVDEAVAYWERAMKVSLALGSHVVSGLTGRENALTVDENLPLFQERFQPICRRAEDLGVKVALEPWPGSVLGHGPYRWTNMATTPELWTRLIDAVPSPALGMEYDPSHFAWQQIDHLWVISAFGDRIHHMHAKDILFDEQKLAWVGVHGKGWWRFVIPGLGELDWDEIFEALADADYQGDVAVEHEDREYLHERWDEGLAIARGTLRPLVKEYNG